MAVSTSLSHLVFGIWYFDCHFISYFVFCNLYFGYPYFTAKNTLFCVPHNKNTLSYFSTIPTLLRFTSQYSLQHTPFWTSLFRIFTWYFLPNTVFLKISLYDKKKVIAVSNCATSKVNSYNATYLKLLVHFDKIYVANFCIVTGSGEFFSWPAGTTWAAYMHVKNIYISIFCNSFSWPAPPGPHTAVFLGISLAQKNCRFDPMHYLTLD